MLWCAVLDEKVLREKKVIIDVTKGVRVVSSCVFDAILVVCGVVEYLPPPALALLRVNDALLPPITTCCEDIDIYKAMLEQLYQNGFLPCVE